MKHRSITILKMSLILGILVGCASVTSGSSNPQNDIVPFEHVIIDTDYSDEVGDCKALGDIDGDGFLDIVFAGDKLYWYAWPNLDKSVVIQANVEFTTDMQLGDVDNDNDLDVIVPDGGEVVWFENPRPSGNPTNADWTRHVIGQRSDWEHDISAGDLDGDGKLDVVTRRGQTNVWLQDNPTKWLKIPISERNFEGLALEDIDRDSDLDVVINGYWIETPEDLVNGEWKEHRIVNGWNEKAKVETADMNSDGRVDVLLSFSETNGGRIAWFEAPNDPKNGKWSEHVIDSLLDYAHSLQAADMDKDGDLDVMAAEMAQSDGPDEVNVYFNEGDAFSWTEQVIATTGSHNAQIGDLGSDGDMDIVGANWQGPPLELWENKLDEQVIPSAGLKAWFTADTGVNLDGGKVSSWLDQSENSLEAIQDDPSKRPLYIENILSGQPVVRFDGVDDFLTFAPLDLNGWSEMTIFIFSANTSFETSQFGDEGGEHGTTNAALLFDETGPWGTVYLSPFQNSVSARFGTGQENNINIWQRPAAIGNTFSLSVAVMDGTDSDKLFVNGEQVANFDDKLSTIKNTGNSGWLARGRGDTYFTGDIAEVIIYDRALSTAARQIVESYLKQKYFGGEEAQTFNRIGNDSVEINSDVSSSRGRDHYDCSRR